MKCPHCNVAIRFESEGTKYWFDDDDSESDYGFGIEYARCPNCNNLIINYLTGTCSYMAGGKVVIFDNNLSTTEIIYPTNSLRIIEPEVPNPIATDFKEASAVLTVSPKASAALSRRILQNVLREQFGIVHKSLDREIEEFISRTDVPSSLKDAVDAIRVVGNFAAHPMKDTNTSEIAEVEPGEAEWLLDVLDSLFDFAYVQPVRLAEKKRLLNEKLQKLGKPPMKSA